MAKYTRAREKKLRSEYRRKILVVVIIMLIIGLVAGYVLSYLYNNPLETIFGSKEPEGFETAPEVTPEIVYVETTPEVIYITPEPAPEMTPQIIYLTPEPTEVPTEAPTPVVTAAPATEAPTAVPTEAPTEVPTEAPAEEPTEEPVALPVLAAAAEATQSPVETVLSAPAETEAPSGEEETGEDEIEAEQPEEQPNAVIVPYGKTMTVSADIDSEGKVLKDRAGSAYENVKLDLTVVGQRGPDYYEKNYGDSYQLTGDEAVVEFKAALRGYEGSTAVIPQNFLLISLQGETDDVAAQGYQLMDKEISGTTGVAVANDTDTELFKRYPYNAENGDMSYMVVTAYVNGEETTYMFELIPPEPEEGESPVGAGLTVGSSGEEVTRLQRKLIEMRLLSGEPDGKFGRYTAEAVRTVQKRFGMEPTGIADQAFLDKLYE